MRLFPLVQLHFERLPLGLPHKINGREVLAVTLTFYGRTLERFREMRGNRRRVIAESFERPALLHAWRQAAFSFNPGGRQPPGGSILIINIRFQGKSGPPICPGPLLRYKWP